MAIDGIFYLEQVVGGVKTPITTGTYYLRATPFSSNTYGPQTPDANGKLNFGTIADNEYELWTDSAKVNNFGVKWLGDKSPTFVTVTATTIVAGTISEASSGAGVTIDGVLIKDNLDTSGIVAKSGTQTGIAGSKTWTGLQTYSLGTTHNINSSGSGSTYYPNAAFSDGYVAPVSDYEFVPKKYVDDQIVSVSAAPFQESGQHRRVITNGTTETNKVYTTISAAIASMTPTSNYQCWVELVGLGGTISLSHAHLVDYCHITGQRHHNLILGTTSASVTKNVIFKGLTIYMSNIDIVGGRTYNGLTFEDCVIYAYHTLTLTNCKIRNCMVYQGSGHTILTSGNTEIINTVCTQSITGETTGFIANTTDEVNTGYSMPTDPLTP